MLTSVQQYPLLPTAMPPSSSSSFSSSTHHNACGRWVLLLGSAGASHTGSGVPQVAVMGVTVSPGGCMPQDRASSRAAAGNQSLEQDVMCLGYIKCRVQGAGTGNPLQLLALPSPAVTLSGAAWPCR